jgi:two-component system, NtrC family, sensor histidine kinase HydH
MVTLNVPDTRGWSRLRAQDLVWVLLFGGLIASAEVRDFSEIALLAAIGALEVLEPRIPWARGPGSRVFWLTAKLVLGYLLIGYTGGLQSRYWLILVLPVVSAGTMLGVLGTLLFSLMAGGLYLSFLLFIDWRQFTLDWPEISEIAFRLLFLPMVGNVTNSLSAALRSRSEQYRRTAEQLAEANVHLREAEEAVRRSDRLAALGQLSAGLAHELRNPLGTIKGSAELLARSISGENEIAREMAGFVTSEVDRANSLITRFLQFARPLQIRPEQGDLTQMLDRAIAMAEREAPGISFYRNYAPEIAPFPFDSELLERVFYNLALNAAQASPAGGTVTLKTRARGEVAEVAVIDRGSGIKPENLRTIFNPFFTTKPAGVGLGLSIVSKIVDEHGGKITVESEPEKGSVFRVQLPMGRLAEPTT